MWRPLREYKYEWDILQLRCTVCKERKTIDRFYKYKSKPFWVTTRCKECQKIYAVNNSTSINEYQKKYRVENKHRISEQHKEHSKVRTEQLWFNRKTFHTRAFRYATKNKIIPVSCPICWAYRRIEMHHPSYESFDKWSEVVFCCSECHHGIHAGFIKNPKVENLLNLSYNQQ